MSVPESAMSTDDDILSGIEFTDEENGITPNADESTPAETGAQVTEGVSQSPVSDQTSQTTKPSSAGNAQLGADGKPLAQQPATQETYTPYSRDARLRQDSKGNLVGADGAVVIASGLPRRLFEQKESLSREVTNLSESNASLQQQLAQANSINTAPQTLGLSSEEAQMGMQLAASFKADPVGTIKYILTQAQADGHNIEGVGDGADIRAMRQIIDERLAPLTQGHAVDQQAAASRQEAVNELNTFYGKYTNASTHEDVLTQMLTTDSNVSLEVAYLQLENYAVRNGLNMDEPLRPQLERKAQEQQQSGQPGTQVQQQQPVSGVRPMLSGQATVQVAPSQQQGNDVGQVYDDPSASWGDIVKRALSDARSNQ